MGQFSWLDCKTGGQILDDVSRKSYVLVPKEFGGGHIEEHCYDGYGNFDVYDIYDLVADWNKEYLSEELLEEPTLEQYGGDEKYYKAALRRRQTSINRMEDFKAGMSEAYMSMNYGNDWRRMIGIDIACYDEQNARLKYPIKITHDANAVYEDCKPSLSDPNQGWLLEDDEEDDWECETLDDELEDDYE